MKKEIKVDKLFFILNHYIIFFLFVAFIISCCIMLFVSTLSNTLEITFTEEHIKTAAMLTFGNVIFLSLLFTVIDAVRRKFMINRPVKKIIDTAEKFMQGNFDVRIEQFHRSIDKDSFNQIIDCFNQMAEELSGMETLRTDFIANVSHELKTPLAVIQNYGTMLQQANLSEECRIEYSKAITNTSHRLATLITNILKLNKLENQQIYPQITEYDLGEQLCECLLQYENVWEKSEIEIDTDIKENVSIEADSELLSLVWNNLFSNAFKFTEAGGIVSVSLSTSEDYAVVRVKDTGCGMSAEVGAHIFEKFYQGDTSHSTQGNGLGLALVKRVVDIMQGEISVQSVVGEGTVFTVKIRRK
ncbi:MAG: HAMP domain-containing sensor histidine kinase [Acutalibacteraceae bacterium]|nr:HAMP domain-containing sensor histidine kinase [Acutalibacteraceae bacterium]